MPERRYILKGDCSLFPPVFEILASNGKTAKAKDLCDGSIYGIFHHRLVRVA